MRSNFLLAFAIVIAGYQYDFPRDHFNHAAYQTEWWYYTGNLQARDGHRFGFELTFFRRATQRTDEGATAWRPDQIYLAHLALSDIDGQKFFHTERLNRAGPGLAGADLASQRVWNGNWQVRWTGSVQELTAVCESFSLRLALTPQKPVVINGANYISFTRLGARGELQRGGVAIGLSGLAWMDHEWMDRELPSWDWFAIQLDNDEELMLYRLRTKSGLANPYSFGTHVDSDGTARFLTASQFTLSPSELWQSPESGARYPVAWSIAIPSLDLQLSERPALKAQELFSAHSLWPTYWEGAVTYQGRIQGRPAKGVGYLEMTGYK